MRFDSNRLGGLLAGFLLLTGARLAGADGNDLPPLPTAIAEIARRYAGVTEWQGFFEATETGSAAWEGGGGGYSGSTQIERKSHGQFRIKHSTAPSASWDPKRGMFRWGGETTELSGEATASESEQFSRWDKWGGGEEWQKQVTGTVPVFGAEFEIWLTKKYASIRVGAPKEDLLQFERVGRMVSHHSRGDGQRHLIETSLNKTEKVFMFLPPLSPNHWNSAATYRIAGGGPGVLVFNCEGTSRADTQKSTPEITHRSRVILFPVYDDVEVEVTIADYDKWLPKGNTAAPPQPGSRLHARATLIVRGDASKEPPRVKHFRFVLEDASREPGVCMNWPRFGADGDQPPAKDPKPDLRFAQGSGVKLSNEDLTADIEPQKNREGQDSATALIDCYDFGGNATLRVVCELEDGREVCGIMERNEGRLALIPVPYRRTGSWIAKSWAERHNLNGSDGEDLDDLPAGDGNRGDGFSNYEEYRGFVQDGDHLRTKPAQKDLFVQNHIGKRALPGLFRFTDLTQLAVHYELKESEMPGSRRMNVNRSAESPRTSQEHQHGLILDLIGGGVASMADIEGDFWRPKTTKRVSILALLLDPAQADELAATIAHEILHAISVRHHGEFDEGRVAWIRGDQATAAGARSWFEERSVSWQNGGLVVSTQPGQEIRIFAPNGSELRAADFPDVLKQSVVVYVGNQQGQHSGVVDCVMRYDCAQWFVPPGRVRDRFPSPGEPTGMGLCSAAVGTDFNAPGQPIVRYGNATRGECDHQFCVRDDAPDRGKAP